MQLLLQPAPTPCHLPAKDTCHEGPVPPQGRQKSYYQLSFTIGCHHDPQKKHPFSTVAPPYEIIGHVKRDLGATETKTSQHTTP